MATVIHTVKNVSKACGLTHITPRSVKNHIIHDVTKHIDHIKK